MSHLTDLNKSSGLFCCLCDFLTISPQDQISKLECGVCRSCELKFFQPNSDAWNQGWRPDIVEISKFKKEIEKSVYSILGEIDNYI